MTPESKLTVLLRFFRTCLLVSLCAVVVTIGLYWYLDRLSIAALATGLKWAGFALASVGTFALLNNNFANAIIVDHTMVSRGFLSTATIRDPKTARFEMLAISRSAVIMLMAAVLTAGYGYLLDWLINNLLQSL